MPQFTSNPNVPLIGQGGSNVRDFAPDKRFNIPNVYEIFRCDDATGSFMLLTNPTSLEQAEATLAAMLSKHGPAELRNQKLFLVRVERSPLKGNFNPDYIGAPSPLKIGQPDNSNDAVIIDKGPPK